MDDIWMQHTAAKSVMNVGYTINANHTLYEFTIPFNVRLGIKKPKEMGVFAQFVSFGAIEYINSETSNVVQIVWDEIRQRRLAYTEENIYVDSNDCNMDQSDVSFDVNIIIDTEYVLVYDELCNMPLIVPHTLDTNQTLFTIGFVNDAKYDSSQITEFTYIEVYQFPLTYAGYSIANINVSASVSPILTPNPTLVPTVKPTFKPTPKDTDITNIDFEYMFFNVTIPLFESITGSIDNIQEIIETLLSRNNDFEYIDIEITNKNQIILVNNTVTIEIRVTIDSIYSEQIVDYSESNEYQNQFEKEVEKELNTTVTVTVTHKKKQSIISFLYESADLVIYIIIVIMSISVLLTIVAFIMNTRKWRTDSAKPLVLFYFGVRITDVITDINLAYVLWLNSMEQKKDATIFALFIACCVFILIPWIVNILSIHKVKTYLSKNKRSALWFSNPLNVKIFVLLVFVTGDAFFAAQVISSYVFGLKLFDAGISEKIDIEKLRAIKIYGVIALENVPQLILAGIYAFVVENESIFKVAFVSMVISFVSIFVCVVFWCLNKLSGNGEQFTMVEYSITLGTTETAKIKEKVGYKRKIRNNICKQIAADKDELEIVYISDKERRIHLVQSVYVGDLEHDKDVQDPALKYISKKYMNPEANNALKQWFKTYYEFEKDVDFEVSGVEELTNTTYNMVTEMEQTRR
eukprot:42341_1